MLFADIQNLRLCSIALPSARRNCIKHSTDGISFPLIIDIQYTVVSVSTMGGGGQLVFFNPCPTFNFYRRYLRITTNAFHFTFVIPQLSQLQVFG